MTLSPFYRKLFLTIHITFSVGWLGAVVVFLALALTGLNSQDSELARASLLAMELSAWFVIVPFCLLSLFSGVVQAVGTKWGLFKHYWIVVKLFLTVVSTLLLLLHMQPIGYLANVASQTAFSSSQYSAEIINIISKTGAAILALLVITTISIYKPWGKIQFKKPENNSNPINTQNNAPLMKKSFKSYLLIALFILIVVIIIKHVLGGGMKHH